MVFATLQTRHIFRIFLLWACIFYGGMGFASKPAQETYSGHVTRSMWRQSGSVFVFSELNSSTPFVTRPSGQSYKVRKVYQDPELIVLFYISTLTGGSETYYINTKHKQFTLIEISSNEARIQGNRITPTITHGSIK